MNWSLKRNPSGHLPLNATNEEPTRCPTTAYKHTSRPSPAEQRILIHTPGSLGLGTCPHLLLLFHQKTDSKNIPEKLRKEHTAQAELDPTREGKPLKVSLATPPGGAH